MRTIYEGARLVIVWPGVEDRTSAVIMASVERLRMRTVEAGLKESLDFDDDEQVRVAKGLLLVM